jgi:hypothetical protein
MEADLTSFPRLMLAYAPMAETALNGLVAVNCYRGTAGSGCPTKYPVIETINCSKDRMQRSSGEEAGYRIRSSGRNSRSNSW